MTDEMQMEYRALVDSSMLNSRRDIQISGLLRIIETTLEEHLMDIGMDNPKLVREENISWAFLSLTAEVLSPIEPGEVLTGRTWFSGRRGPLFRRELEYRHADGSRAAAFSCFSGLIDLSARKIIRDRTYLERYSLPAGEPLLEADSRMTPELDKYREADRRKIYPSWLDGLGHVNNSRYGDMIFDTLSAAGSFDGLLRRLELYFVGELHEGEEVSLLLRREPGCASVLGVHGQSGEAAFCSRVFFD